ncbi:MAG TPA: hypothetical protein VFO25_08475 [Candidatus Eremiobacteraceae bacterium]|nr:hypothetical protein [Candidatus Eremiobacteraceae bacterium]
MSQFDDEEENGSAESVEMGDRARAAFRSIPPAPLRILIDDFLTESSGFAGAEWMRRIAALNQGSARDLDEAEFKSYVLYRTGLTEEQLLKCRFALRSFTAARETASGGVDEDLLVAARGDSEGAAVSASELLEQLKKRQQ